jgi:hypothetical protein
MYGTRTPSDLFSGNYRVFTLSGIDICDTIAKIIFLQLPFCVYIFCSVLFCDNLSQLGIFQRFDGGLLSPGLFTTQRQWTCFSAASRVK